MGSKTDFIDTFLVRVTKGAPGGLFPVEVRHVELNHKPKGTVTTFRLT